MAIEVPETAPAGPTFMGKSLYFWGIAAGVVIAAGGAIYLLSRPRGKRKRLTGKAKKALKKVQGGVLVAVASGIANKLSQKAVDKVV